MHAPRSHQVRYTPARFNRFNALMRELHTAENNGLFCNEIDRKCPRCTCFLQYDVTLSRSLQCSYTPHWPIIFWPEEGNFSRVAAEAGAGT